jgi:hypothetical protein
VELALCGAGTFISENTSEVLKCGTGEGCMRSFGPIVWKIKKHYIESRTELLIYDNK